MIRRSHPRIIARLLRIVFSTLFMAVLVALYLTVFTRGGIWP